MGKRIQNVYRKKQQRKPALRKAKAAKKPVGNERIGKKAAAKSINGKQG